MRFRLLPVLLLAPILLCTGGPDKDDPWSVKVRRYRSLPDAEQVVERLKDKDINAYLVQTYSKGEDMWHVVHAGVFEKKSEAKKLQKRLKKLGIKKTKVLHFKKFKKKIKAYKKLSSKAKKAYKPPEKSFASITPAVRESLRRFPIDSLYKIVHLRIADMAGLKRSATVKSRFRLPKKYLPKGLKQKHLMKSAIAISQATYKEKLFGHKAGVTIIATNNAKLFAKLQKKVAKKNRIVESDLAFDTDLGKLSGTLYARGKKKRFSFVGQFDDGEHLMIMKASGLEDAHFRQLLQKDNDGDGLLIAPEVWKNISVLPRKGDTANHFAYYELTRLKSKYARTRRNVWWARKMVGHWTASGWFVRSGRPLVVSFFNLTYKKTAKSVHGNFRAEKAKANKNALYKYYAALAGRRSYAMKVTKKTRGWLIDDRNFNELSFSKGSLVIAINSYKQKLPASDLKKVARDLRIW